MILSTEIIKPVKKILNLINNFTDNIQSIALQHGSSAVITKSFYISDISLFREKCNECDDAYISRVCNRCGEGVCSKSACSWDFPHYYNTI